MFKKFISFTLIGFFLLLVVFPVNVFASTVEPRVQASAAILIETESGRVLFGKSQHEKRAMASTTKTMTAIVALENGNLEDIVKVSPYATSIRGSSAYISSGQEYKLEDLLYGMMLVSGNDAATAIAEHISGSVKEFAKLMTQKAFEIGLTDTCYKNPHGLDAPGHYTTAYDLAMIARFGYKNPKFEKIITSKQWVMPKGDRDYTINNINRLLYEYDGANGVKTGYTGKAGRCLIASAKRDGMHLISVLLNSSNRWHESKQLLDYGFKNFKKVKIAQKGTSLKEIDVKGGRLDSVSLTVKEDIIIPLRADENERIKVCISYPEYLFAPVKEQQPVGKIKVLLDDIQIFETDLVPSNSVTETKINDIYNKMFKYMTGLV